ncbi:TRAP transporter large permease subunit [Vibrio mediterranei]|uniref:TRAP transporter large permease n=1 Tax=Vibrio mediterranei TaxID=689 RepID=UPI001EFE10FC|nr:TRAP transporter large permease subunit [Vibrio mediterranei]MCG9623244.1 TRAP transporter large permease subunit [Vibrio mediterranei]
MINTNTMESGYHSCFFDKFDKVVNKMLKPTLIITLGIMSILIVYQVFCRYILNSPSNVSSELLTYMLIWLGLLGASACFLQSKHLNLPIVLDKVSEDKQDTLLIVTIIASLLFGGIVTYSGYVGLSNQAFTPILKMNLGLLQSVVMVLGSVICLSCVVKLSKLFSKNRNNLIKFIILSVFIGLIILGYAEIKSNEISMDYIEDNVEILSFLVLFISFFFFLLIGMPIAVGLGIAGLMTLSLQMNLSELVSTTGETLFASLNNFGFLALPFFILAGNIMNQGGIARRLINFAMLIGRRIPGSLWQTNIVANMLFGSLSGSAIAASTAIGGIITPMAKEKKYDMPFSTAVNAASSISGMLIPPTGVFIVYSLITGGGASIAALFLAGYIPGFIIGLSVMVVAYVYAKKNNYPVSKASIDFKSFLNVLWGALPSLMLIFIVIGGIIGGVFTAIEASGIAVAYSLLLSVLYKTITLESLTKILYDSAISSAVILFLIACSSVMSWSMTFAFIPDTVAEMLISFSDNKYVILALINITLLIVGVFMDMSPALLIFTPILYPIVTGLGVDPVHFGVIMVYNLSMGVVTPPVGTVLFVSCGITGEKITSVIKPLLPIFLVQIIGLMLITYFPVLSLALPRIFGLN